MYYHSFNGSTFRSAWDSTDFALFQLDTPPLTASTGIKYAGWTRTATAATSSVCIHHPNGDVMKISVDDDDAVADDWFGGDDTHWLVEFDDGVVEKGSSGASLFNQNGLVVGQLAGYDENDCTSGDDNDVCFCSQPEAQFGRFDLSWAGGGTDETRLSNWLTNVPAVTQVSTIPIPSISGPELLCTSGTYTLNNAPSTTVTWSASPSTYVSPSSGTGTTANISKVISGDVTITFSVGCGNPNDFSYTFHTGTYSSSDYEVSGPSSASCDSYVYYTIPELVGVTSINWIWPYDWSYSRGQGTRYLDLITGDNGGMVGARVNNTCGVGGSYDMLYTSVYGYCGGYYMAFPNPASNYVEIDINPEAIEMNAMSTDSEQEKLIKVYDEMGIIYYSSEFKKLPYRLKTNKLPEGNYVVQIIDGQNTSSIQIIIER